MKMHLSFFHPGYIPPEDCSSEKIDPFSAKIVYDVEAVPRVGDFLAVNRGHGRIVFAVKMVVWETDGLGITVQDGKPFQKVFVELEPTTNGLTDIAFLTHKILSMAGWEIKSWSQ